MSNLKLKIVTPERILSEVEAQKITLPTRLGEVTILPNHAPLVAALIPGELVYSASGESINLSIAGGFLHVEKGNMVNILADAGERVEEINLERAEEARKRAEEALKQPGLSEEEYALTISALERSLSRIRIVRKHANTRTRPVTSEGVLRNNQ